jgi:hypothetical protein
MIANILHPIFAGFSAFLATVIGSYFFNLNNNLVIIILGAILFFFANNALYKFKFDSYNLNGVTTTTIVIFVTQAASMLIWKGSQVKFTWIAGVICIIVGVTLLEKNKNKKESNNQKK